MPICVDCGGYWPSIPEIDAHKCIMDEPNQSTGLVGFDPKKLELGLAEPSEECPDCGKTFGDGIQCQNCDWNPHDHFGD